MINEYLLKYRSYVTIAGVPLKDSTPHVICKDGFQMSVQAGRGCCSTPTDDEADYYSSVEVSSLSDDEPLLDQFRNDEQCEGCYLSDYHYVPVEVINEVLEKHGGVDYAEVDRLLALRRSK